MSATSLPNFSEVSSPGHFQSLLTADLSRISLINFWASWAEPCIQMNEVVAELAKKYPQLLVLQVRSRPIDAGNCLDPYRLQVDAEEQADISESFEIEAVPSFIILQASYSPRPLVVK